ncbi:MAG: hypothetical protein AAB358_00545 [Patescibacteria group bacterium]
MLWLPITIFAYLLNAVAVTVDKFLLTKKIPNPAVYAFFISFLNLFVLVLIPFGFTIGSIAQIIIALIAGAIFAFALLYMFKALSGNEASRIIPFLGGLQPIFIFVLALFFLGEILTTSALVAFLFIVLGTITISWQSGKTNRQSYLFALVATILFAISYTTNKYIFIDQGFISGFVWTRIGAFLGALLLLIPAQNRKDIFKTFKNPKSSQGSGKLFLFGQVCGALSFIMVNYAISISSSVAVVNALQGVQYVFLLLLIGLLSRKFPKLLKEKFTPSILIQKVTATVLIITGLFLLFI